MKSYKLNQSFSYDTFKFKGEKAKEGDRYYEIVRWFGIPFFPIYQFVTLELQQNRWNVVSL